LILDDFIKTCRENTNLVTIGQKYRVFYMKTKLQFIATGDVKSP